MDAPRTGRGGAIVTGMAPLPDVLKVELRVEVNDQPLVIHVQVQGEGESARRAAAELSDALTNTLAALPNIITGTPLAWVWAAAR